MRLRPRLVVEILESRLAFDGRTFVPRVIDQENVPGFSNTAYSISGDIDGDDDLDLFIALHNDGTKVRIYRRTGEGNDVHFESGLLNEIDATSVLRMWAQDVDGDNDIDLLTIGKQGHVSWFANISGFGDQWSEHPAVIPDLLRRVLSVTQDDIDGDGDRDLVYAVVSPFDDASLLWNENLGEGNYSETQSLFDQNPVWTRINDLESMDVDKDGDLDLVAALQDAQLISWYENIDGSKRFASAKSLAQFDVPVFDIQVMDANGDDDLDIVASIGSQHDTLILLENEVGQFALKWLGTEADGAELLIQQAAFDIDSDGNNDILFVTEDCICIRYNSGEQFHVASYLVKSLRLGLDSSTEMADLDGDGDLDWGLLKNNDRAYWLENMIVGDVNDDGAFDSQDLISVFQVGQYEDQEPKNSSFEEGDWNGDGEFDSTDLVLAFRAGLYHSTFAEEA